jgi:hypothetical protein
MFGSLLKEAESPCRSSSMPPTVSPFKGPVATAYANAAAASLIIITLHDMP